MKNSSQKSVVSSQRKAIKTHRSPLFTQHFLHPSSFILYDNVDGHGRDRPNVGVYECEVGRVVVIPMVYERGKPPHGAWHRDPSYFPA